MKPSPNVAAAAAGLFVLIASQLGALAAQTEEFPPVKLRGYGILSGSATFLSVANTQGSVLRIACEDEAKARIVQSKYLSDLQLLPGVKAISLPSKSGPVAAFDIDNVGAVLAARQGADVTVLAAGNPRALFVLEAQVFLPGQQSVVFVPEGSVPMYLDRWDKYGMRFYYVPLTKPKGLDGKDIKNYDPSHDIDFARHEGKCGLVLWQGVMPAHAECVMKTPMWDWVVKASQKAGLTVGINTNWDRQSWLFNRYRDQAVQRQPQYLGGCNQPIAPADEGILSWNAAPEVLDAALTATQQTVRQFSNVDNVINWLEPQGEIGFGPVDSMIDFGPQADVGYREFLKSKYNTVQAVSRRWFGNETALGSWENVHVPELASFLGWGKDAVDLTGTWRISRDAPFGQASAAPAFDDSRWPTLTAPGHAIAILLPSKPAVMRRHITIDSSWRNAHPKVWLYVWDLSDTRPGSKRLKGQPDTFVNGTALAEAAPADPHSRAHWAAYEVSGVLKNGDNTVVIDVPQGFLNYRAYLSPQQPRGYPDLGPQLNAQWADFIDWGSWSRARTIRRSVQAIRQVDPDRPITFHSPDSYSADIKQVCEDYGGVFHNTGYMAGVWRDYHPMEMESADLPTDVEPGGPAKSLDEFKCYLGRWGTEGVQGIDYFMHIGDVEWNDEMRNYFHETINLWHLIGKYHVPKAQIAQLSSDRVIRLTDFPWHPDPKRFPRTGHDAVRPNEILLADYPREEVCEQDFDRGHTDAYKVIIDTNTSVLDDEFLAKIEKWVKSGGIFVTYGETGRHTSTEMDAWPISKLSGYTVVDRDKASRALELASRQPFSSKQDNWSYKNTLGLSLKKAASDCTDIMLWKDGSVAAGMRPLGKGYVIQVGPRFDKPDALHFFQTILDWAKIERIPAVAEGVLMRHFVSNNGIYDVWAMWNEKPQPAKTNLVFRNGLRPPVIIDVKTGKPVGTELSFEPLETRVLLTPRSDIAAIPSQWFTLQRNWWRGTVDPGPPLAPFQPKITLDLQSDWSFKPLAGTRESAEGAALAGATVNDSWWEKRSLGIFSIPDHPNVHHGIFRKQFTIPKGWTGQHVSLWIQEWHGGAYLEKGRTFLDGKPVSQGSTVGAPQMANVPVSDAGIAGDEMGGALKAGTTHTLAIEIWGEGAVVGSPASAWLAYRPDPAGALNLSGPWAVAADGLSYGAPSSIPGQYAGMALRRVVNVDAARSGQNAVIHVEATDRSLRGVIVNGTWVTRFRHYLGNTFDLNITPYVKFGQENEIILIGSDGKHAINQVALNFYEKGVYP